MIIRKDNSKKPDDRKKKPTLISKDDQKLPKIRYSVDPLYKKTDCYRPVRKAMSIEEFVS